MVCMVGKVKLRELDDLGTLTRTKSVEGWQNERIDRRRVVVQDEGVVVVE